MFRGTFQHAIDAKGRTSLPAKFREQVSSGGADYVVVTQGPDRALWCFAPAEWDALVAQFAARSPFDPKVRAFVNQFVSPAQDCPFDKMGRVLVPPLLRAYAGLDGEVVWAGAINHIELWSAEGWARRNEATASVLDGDPFGGGGL